MAKKNNVDEVVTPVEEVVEETVETTEPAPIEIKKGVVKGCVKLNIRKEPDKNSKPIDVVKAETTLSVDVTNSTKGWLKVTTESGKQGYCMKQYVSIKR